MVGIKQWALWFIVKNLQNRQNWFKLNMFLTYKYTMSLKLLEEIQHFQKCDKMQFTCFNIC